MTNEEIICNYIVVIHRKIYKPSFVLIRYMTDLQVHTTYIKDPIGKSGKFPTALREAESLLVQERSNFVPIYMPSSAMNVLESTVSQPEEARESIEAFKGNVKKLVYGMLDWGSETFGTGIILSKDLDSQIPAITIPKESGYSFEFKPKAFNLGLTGRLLEDDGGQRYQERLILICDIYDAYNLASFISPEKIVAVLKDGRKLLINYKNNEVGPTETFNGGSKKFYVLHEEKKWLDKQEVLPTAGLKIVFSDFYEKIREKYGRSSMLVGHKFENLKELLSYVSAVDEHVYWDICVNNNDPNVPIFDCEAFRRNHGQEPWSEDINRVQPIPSNASIPLDGIHIVFDKAAVIQALVSLDDVIRDIWMEPLDRGINDGWDIVLDRSRGIIPENPVKLITKEEIIAYPVLK